MRGRVRRQRGAVAVTTAILFLIIVGYALVVALEMSGGEMMDAVGQSDNVEAYFLAESGLERAVKRFADGTACNTLAPDPDDPISFGRGTFELLSATDVGGNCRIVVQGRIGNVVRQISEDVSPKSLIYDFREHFPDAADFAANWSGPFLTRTQGSSGWNSQYCPSTICTDDQNPDSGSFLAQTNTRGRGDRYIGYWERDLPQPIDTRGGRLNITYSLGYQKIVQNNRARRFIIRVRLYDSAAGRQKTLWQNSDITTTGGWIYLADQPASLPRDRLYDKLRIEFRLRERGNNPMQVWVDEIRINFVK